MAGLQQQAMPSTEGTLALQLMDPFNIFNTNTRQHTTTTPNSSPNSQFQLLSLRNISDLPRLHEYRIKHTNVLVILTANQIASFTPDNLTANQNAPFTPANLTVFTTN